MPGSIQQAQQAQQQAQKEWVRRDTESNRMSCLKCRGFMMVERHYTLVNRRLYARCLNCGFWLDLADLLRFFYKVIDSGVQGLKVRETLTL